MQNDLVLRVAQKIPYPWVYRHNRSIYKQHSSIDPALLLQKIILASMAGYCVGVLMGRWRKSLALLAPVPLIVKFLNDERNLSKTAGKYLGVPVTKRPQIELAASQHGKKVDPPPTAINRAKPNWINNKLLPPLESKIYNAKDFLVQLPKSYFQP